MKASPRAEKILGALRERGEISVGEICSRFGISPATARRDFIALADEGKAEKTWGGLRLLDPTIPPMLPSGLRETLHIEEKRKIAARAALFCQDDEIIFIDGGTTTLQLAPWLAARQVRIVTNSLLMAHEIDRLRAGQGGGAEVFLTGGYLYPRSGLLVGPEAVTGLQRYRAGLAFLSVGGISEEGISNNHPLVVEIERTMLTRAGRVILLADHSKFDRQEMVPECAWNEIGTLVTDQLPPPRYHPWLESKIIVASVDNRRPLGIEHPDAHNRACKNSPLS